MKKTIWEEEDKIDLLEDSSGLRFLQGTKVIFIIHRSMFSTPEQIATWYAVLDELAWFRGNLREEFLLTCLLSLVHSRNPDFEIE